MFRLTRLITLRSIWTRRLRTLLSTFGIVLGVAGILAIGVTNQAALRSLSRLFEDTSGRTHLEVHSADTASTFNESTVRLVSSFPNIASAAPLIKVPAALVEKNTKKSQLDITLLGAGTSGLLLYGIDPQLDRAVRSYKMTDGKFLSDDPSVFEIVLVAPYADEHKIHVGDRILIQTSSGQAKLRVVGLIAKEGPGQLNLGNFGIVSLRAGQKLRARDGEIDQIDLVANTGYTDPEALELLRGVLQTRLGQKYSVVFPPNQGERMAQMLSGYQIGLNFMGSIALFVGAFLIYNAFSMTVVERTREFGLLRAIGITRGQIIGQVLVEGLLLGLFGATLGAGLGLLMSRGLIQIMSVMLDVPLDAGGIQLDVVISSMVIGMLLTLLSAVLPAVQAGRISPLEALRMRAQSQTGWLMKFGFPIGLVLLLFSTGLLIWNPFPYDVQFRLGSIAVFTLFIGAMLMIPASTGFWEILARKPFQILYGSGGQIGARNLQRAQLRTMLTTAALMVGVSMIVVIQGMTTSFSTDLKSWMDAYIGGDLYVNSSVPLKRKMQDRFEAVNGVLAAAPIRYLEVTWQRALGVNEKINLMAVIPSSYTTVTQFVFNDPQTDVLKAIHALDQSGTIFISSVISEKYGLDEGDQIWLQTRTGLKPFQVAAVVMDFYNQGMVVTGNWADMQRFFRVDDASTFLVKVRSDASVDQVKDQIDSLYGKRYQLSLESNATLKERAFGLMGQAFRMFDVLGVIAVMVAALGVVNTVTMSVIERTREIGMLRSIGLTRWQVVMMVLAEAGLLGIIGGILGLAFGVLLTKIFLESMKAMSGYSLALVIPTQTIYTAIVVALVVSHLAALLPAIRAARAPVLEAIHYE